MAMNNKRFVLVPPDKGSFPLDHENICKELMLKYLDCLYDNERKVHSCRQEIKAYLDCRMKNDLMAKEEWSKLGFSESEGNKKLT